jgi:fused signal recognition particle receptor
MALGFIKKVFTFGKDKPAEQAPQVAETKAIEAELEAHSREEHLPLSSDPVVPEEMDTAGGPAADVGEADAEEGDASILPDVGQLDALGVTPLSLLEAEGAAEASEDGAPAADQAPYEIADRVAEKSEPDVEQGAAPSSISPPLGEVSAEPAEADILAPKEATTPPILPEGFAAGSKTPEPEPLVPQQKLTWFQRLRAGLARTSSQLTGQISALFTKRKLDDETLQDLEDLLIQADLGVETALRVTDTLASERYGKDVSGEDVSRIMAAEIAKVLKPVAKPLQLDLSHKPHVILVVGVNGTGKTTTIGKLAAKLSGAGLKVMVAAGDTFRAAAIEQLKIWADRTKSEFIGTKLGADAAGLAYEAFEQAKAKKCDVLIIDTAGRLQNKAELMAELEKIVRVLGKLDPDAPHTVLQTLDATTGQNALNQVEIFRNVAGVNGLIMTKLDGTARGGILVAISAKHKLPVYFIGVGEGVDDLEPFEAEDFAHAIAGLGQ